MPTPEPAGDVKAMGPESEALRRPAESLVRLYEAMGKGPQAEKWRAALDRR